MKITYEDKVSIQNDEEVAKINKVTDDDMNEIKKVVNTNYDELETAKTSISSIENEQKTQNTNISNLQADNTTNKQDITEIKEKDTEQDKYIAELEAENARLREDLNGLPKGQASGEGIDLNDSAEMRCELKISGNSKQETRSGKNKLEFINGTYTDKNVTAVVKDGVITLNGNPSSTSFVVIDEDFNYTFKANQRYTISLNNSNIINSDEAKFRFSNGTTIIKDINFNSANKKETFYFTEDTLASNIQIRTGTAITYNNFVIKPQLELGSTATEWEQGGASPSPDYPSEVESCGDNINIFDGEVEEGNIDASTGQNTAVTNAWRSKNYLNVKDTSVSISVKDLTFSGTVGRLYFYKSDNTYISNILINSLPFTATLPNETAKVRFFILNSVADINAKIKLEKGSTVTPYSPYGQGCINEVICNYKNLFIKGKGIVIGKFLSSDGSIGTDASLFYQEYYIEVTGGTQLIVSAKNGENFRIAEYDSSKTFIRRDLNTGGTKTYNITLSSNCRYIRVSTTLANLDSLIIQEGSTIANNQSQTYTIPTQQPFRTIGDIRDTFIKKNNKWFERHYIPRKIFDGNENITQSIDDNGDYFYNCYISANKIWSRMLSSHFKYLNGWGDNNVEESIYWGGNGHILTIKVNIDTVDNFKSWLTSQYNAGTPVYVDYILETPLDIECTEEQSTILFDIEQNAKTYDKVTHMYSTDKISSYKEVTYKKDIETLFANTLVESGV